MSIKRSLGMVIILVICLLPPIKGAAVPEPRITILSPGEDSFLTSPIKLSAEIMPDPQGMVRVTLTSRNGDLLARQLIILDTNSSSPTLFVTDVPFEIPTDQTEALLALAIQDAFFRTISVRSVLVSLSSTGESMIQAAAHEEPWLDIIQPKAGEKVSSGELVVTGIVTPISNRPITFELISDSGRVIGSSQLPIETPGEKLDFEINLTYSNIKETSDVRMVIRQNEYPYDEIAILDSLTLIVFP